MTTKTIEKTIIEKKEIYVAMDGKEFESAETCKEWEKGIECVAKTAWNSLLKTKVNTCDCGLPWSSEDEEAYIVVPRNHDDIIALENYARVYARESYGFEDSMINKPLVINFGYDHDWVSVYVVEDYLKMLNKYYSDKIAEVK